jgi:DNA-binding NtrC family response regulator
LTRGDGTILVIDDEDSIRETASTMLETLGYRVVCCSNGRDGVEKYREAHHTIDLIMLDLIMPDLDGFGCYRQIRSIDPAVPVVLMSGYSGSEKVDETMKEGASAFIAKPFRAAALSNTIANVLKSRGVPRHPRSMGELHPDEP